MSTMDPENLRRADRLKRMMNELIRTMPPWKRDRMIQEHLAQARGTLGNAQAVRHLMNLGIRRLQSRRLENRDGTHE